MKRVLFAVVALAVLSTVSVFVQQAASLGIPALQWNRTYGGENYEFAWSVIQTSDGGYCVLGSTNSRGAGGYDFWLVKTDAKGNEQWNRTYGGALQDEGWSLIQTSDKGYLLAGRTKSFDGGQYNDLWLIKVDSNGAVEWNQVYGGGGEDEAFRVVQIIQTTDGGYAIAGRTNSFGAGYYDFWLLKTDAHGNMEWDKTYGGAGQDDARSLVQTGDGGYMLAGYTSSFGAGGYDFWLVKTDTNGNVEWNKTYGGPDDDWAFSMTMTNDHGYALAGRTNSFGNGNWDFWLVKTNATGDKEWDTTFGGTGDDEAFSVTQVEDGGYALCGHTYSFGMGDADAWIVKTDNLGNERWNQTFGGANEDMARSLSRTSDNGLIVAGWTYSLGSGASDFWLMKLAPRKISASVEIDPEILNLKSNGQWITCHIELPETYDVSDINVSTLLLNDTIPVDLSAPTTIGDYNGNGIPDLTVKFNRAMVSHLILSKGIHYGKVALTATGELYDKTLFEGSDVVRVKMPGDVNFDGKVNLNDVLLVAKAICSHPGSPRWNPAADENEDNTINLVDFFIVCKNYGKTYT
jgi:hypothetical protein